MKRLLVVLLALGMCFNVSGNQYDSKNFNEFGESCEENQYIEFQIWQIIFTRNGILVVADQIYNPHMIGYDEEKGLYYMCLDSRIADQKYVKNNPQLIKETKRIKNVLIKKKAYE